MCRPKDDNDRGGDGDGDGGGTLQSRRAPETPWQHLFPERGSQRGPIRRFVPVLLRTGAR